MLVKKTDFEFQRLVNKMVNEGKVSSEGAKELMDWWDSYRGREEEEERRMDEVREMVKREVNIGLRKIEELSNSEVEVCVDADWCGEICKEQPLEWYIDLKELKDVFKRIFDLLTD
jgi:polyhydroxyalkanoate synthesis regulator phasin